MLVFCDLCQCNFVACCGITFSTWGDWYNFYHFCERAKINGYANPLGCSQKLSKMYEPFEVHFFRMTRKYETEYTLYTQHIFSPSCVHKSHDKLNNNKYPLMQKAWWA